jgi:hypothetical protein
MIPDSDYEISSLGQVRDSNSGEPPESWSGPDGTPYVYISEREFGYRGPVWKLMLASYFRGRFDDVQVIHIDGNPRNLDLGNLSWYFFDPRTEENKEIGVRMAGGVRVLDRRLGRKVEVIEKGWVFTSVSECADYIRGDTSNIYACLKGRLKSHQGYTFRYV